MLDLLKTPVGDKVSIDDMATFYQEIFSILQTKKYNILSEAMSTIDIENTNFTVMNGLIRYTFVHRHNIPEWGNFLKKVQDFCQKDRPLHSIHHIKYCHLHTYVVIFFLRKREGKDALFRS